MRNSVLYGIIIIGAFLSLVVINAEFPSFAEAVVTTFQFKTLTCSGCTLTNGTTTITLTTQTGTYNKTLANNVVVNSGGSRINWINGTGNPINVVNDPTRNQVNVTITQPTMSTRTIDLSTAGVYTNTIDNDTADTIISATSEPPQPQFVQTISVGNMPTDLTDVQDYTIFLTVGGKNINATTAKTISIIPTRNGVDVDTTRTISVTNGNFWTSANYLSGAALHSGDKIGLKMWCTSTSCTNSLDFRYATLYIIPREFILSSTSYYTVSTLSTLLTMTGAVSTVTYSTSTPLALFNTQANVAVLDTTLGNFGISAWTTVKGQQISDISTTNSRYFTDTGTTPSQQAASNLASISFPKFARINTLS